MLVIGLFSYQLSGACAHKRQKDTMNAVTAITFFNITDSSLVHYLINNSGAIQYCFDPHGNTMFGVLILI